MPEAILFDFDGVILDTEVAVFEAWKENYRAHGHELPLEIYVGCVGSDFGGFDPKSHLEELVDDAVDWERWDRWRTELAREHVLRLEPFPGVVELLVEAGDSGIPCAVASSSPRSWVEGHLERLDLLGHFVATRCLDDVAAPKPAPDLFLAAAAAVGVEAPRAVVIEDSLNGLLASLEAGIPCVVVPNEVTRHLDFEGAAAVLPSLRDVTVRHLAELREGANA